MSRLELIATATFGLEAVVKREIEHLGYTILKSEDAKISYEGDEEAIVRSNLWLRCADRVLLKIGEFKAFSFEELFQQTKALPWEDWIPEDGKFTVNGSSVKSTLFSVPDCQAIVKKAIVERLKETYHCEWFRETGADYTVKVAILKDSATLTIDTSGAGLHKRGYRVRDVAAPIKETLASAMVQLSYWKQGRLLVDPFCGSGTIVIEAAMLAKNIAPGLNRKFASEGWTRIPSNLWKAARKQAFEAIDQTADIQIMGSDISRKAIEAAKENAEEAGVADCITFSVLPFNELKADEKYGIVICNPPYGERIGERQDLDQIYKDAKRFFRVNPSWSLYFLTSDKEFEKAFSDRPADKRRKLYNGRIETTYYQYYGERPPRVDI
jgi:putative N6-adenine-specific DNA methylase